MTKEIGNIDYLVKSIIKESLISFDGGSVQIYRDTIFEYLKQINFLPSVIIFRSKNKDIYLQTTIREMIYPTLK